MAEEGVISITRAFTYKRADNPEQMLCNHESVEVCEETRTVECKKCNIILDPFDYLKDVCYREYSAFHQYMHNKKVISAMEKRYTTLSKQIEELSNKKKKLTQR